MAKHEVHERLHKLLRGELAAVESYEKAFAERWPGPSVDLLQTFLGDHRRAVSVLSEHIELGGDEPDRTAGPWGSFVRTVNAAASSINEATALKALKEGEVHGLDEYRTALGLHTVPAELRDVVELELLPRQQEHIRELDALIAGLERADDARSLPDRIERKQAAR